MIDWSKASHNNSQNNYHQQQQFYYQFEQELQNEQFQHMLPGKRRGALFFQRLFPNNTNQNVFHRFLQSSNAFIPLFQYSMSIEIANFASEFGERVVNNQNQKDKIVEREYHIPNYVNDLRIEQSSSSTTIINDERGQTRKRKRKGKQRNMIIQTNQKGKKSRRTSCDHCILVKKGCKIISKGLSDDGQIEKQCERCKIKNIPCTFTFCNSETNTTTSTNVEENVDEVNDNSNDIGDDIGDDDGTGGGGASASSSGNDDERDDHEPRTMVSHPSSLSIHDENKVDS